MVMGLAALVLGAVVRCAVWLFCVGWGLFGVRGGVVRCVVRPWVSGVLPCVWSRLSSAWGRPAGG